MTSETRNCQNCQADFVVEPDDFGFYEQMKVPAPTWCPRCRMIRRLSWWGYRGLYKRKCDFTGETVITAIHPDVPFKVYRQDIWWSDKWDPKTYGRDYDFSRSFFDQFQELMRDVPWPSLFTEYTTMVDSDYCNAAATLRNCYLCFKADRSENCAYLNTIQDAKECYDSSFMNFCELCYETVTVNHCYRTFYSQDCDDCHNVYFSRDMVGCADCFGCTGLRSKKYHIFNQPYSKEEYIEKLKEFDLGSRQAVEAIKKQAWEVSLSVPRKEFHGLNAVNSSGDYLWNCRNVNDSFMVMDGENARYCQIQKSGPLAQAYDYTAFSTKAEWIYESAWVGLSVNNIKFGFWDYKSHDLEYSIGCHGSGNLFGCVGIRAGEYCIFNKQYSKEEYLELTAKIRKQMAEVPFVDAAGRKYLYGEFFPTDLCPWFYNESNAYEWFPFSKEEALAGGFKWRDPDAREYKPATMETPDHIKDVTDDILKAILKCDDCGKNYLIIRSELEFYRKMNIPIPRQCSACRDLARVKRLNPMAVLYDRACAKCNKAMRTSYAPERPEIVYCEQCYQQEVS
jgi:hypothetical protein